MYYMTTVPTGIQLLNPHCLCILNVYIFLRTESNSQEQTFPEMVCEPSHICDPSDQHVTRMAAYSAHPDVTTRLEFDAAIVVIPQLYEISFLHFVCATLRMYYYSST